jgi:peptide/nickel transport system substrate-binding protein
VRFRRALSLAIDRGAVNQSIYFGLALEGNNTVLPESPLFKPDYQTRWAKLDLAQANRLLDELDLKRGSDGIRQLADKRPLEIVIETAGEEPEQVDVLQLVGESWKKAGIRLLVKPSQRDVVRNRIFSGEALMAVWSGFENGVATSSHSPAELAPTAQTSLQWPMWGQHYETKGTAGEAPDTPEGQALFKLFHDWIGAAPPQREAIWHKMLELHADHQFTIGIVGGVQQPVVVNRALRNVPEKGIYNWEPGAFFGIYRPETFWFDR